MALIKKLQIDKYYHHDSRDKANGIVRQFVTEKQLVITGGLVVDFALRLKGDKIYEDFEVPDYDFFSPTNTRDACELFMMMVKAGFENVSLLPGIHPSTIKIYVFKDCVADITYINQKLFEDLKLTALTYDGMLFRHPHDQYVDMHRALSYPYENEPRETINFRWTKDFQRFIRLYSYYPVVAAAAPKDIQGGSDAVCGQDRIGGESRGSNRIGVLSGMYAVNYFLGVKSEVDHVYLMDDTDYNEFIKSNANKIKSMKQFSAYRESLPGRTELLLDGAKYTLLRCTNKTGIYYDNQAEATREAVAMAVTRLASRSNAFSGGDDNDKSRSNSDNSAVCGQDRITGINFCVLYCYSMYHITGDKMYQSKYFQLLDIINTAYVKGDTRLFPSIVVYGEEKEKPIIAYTTEHPEAKVTPVHIASDDSQDARDEAIAKLPWDFVTPDIYNQDGGPIKKIEFMVR